jgi:hypothetical protein
MKLLGFIDIDADMLRNKIVIEVGEPDPKAVMASLHAGARHVAGVPRRWWNVKKINLWLKLRRAGLPMSAALRLSMLDAGEALEILNRCAGGLLDQVGFMTMSIGPGGTTFSGVSFSQLGLVLTAVADLASVMSAEKRESLTKALDELEGHNWGGVRRAATAAKAVMANNKAA